jgi:16S rRNA (guanine(966)-N(2))-methyltransferase RsmD
MRQPVRKSPGAARRAHSVRNIGGTWRRTPLKVLERRGLRPTPDRVRETLFNWIAHLRPDYAALRGLDLFAGSGVLGFELASRGAGAVTLVDSDRDSVAALRSLRERLDARQVEIVVGDAFAVLSGFPDAAFDIAFLDPPYESRLLPAALRAVRRVLAPGALVYVEDGRPLDAPDLLGLGFRILRHDRAGQVNFALLGAAGD